ncbi:MAG: PQQ-dependent sugar dehydrogenase [Planctomycetaceae bacterium]
MRDGLRSRASCLDCSRIAGSPDPQPPYVVEPAFPHLTFDKPLEFLPIPGTNRFFVLETAGKLLSITNDRETTQADLAVDFHAARPEITAAYSITTHPQYEQNHYVYVCTIAGADQQNGSVISRFTVTPTDPPTIDPATEQIVYRWWAGGHNGCAIRFGNDGYLYISTGDGAGPDPPDTLRSGQDISNVLSCMLRIDVDHPDGDKPYSVPSDNPFVGMPNARPEIWAYGFRNPWRTSIDHATGDLWVGDVGWQLWEMIYRVEKGGNYGWAITEGPQPVLPEVTPGPTPILPPTVAHPHSEAASITGGYVYHGSRLPELRGVYIYGDYQTGRVWGLRHDGNAVTWHHELAHTPLALVSFGEGLDGELYLVDYERTKTIHRLVPNPRAEQRSTFPRKLSDTGLFTDAARQTSSAGVLPYDINAKQWADFTTSERWMAAPGSEPVQIDDKGVWRFPDGAVLAKTVSIEMERGVPSSQRRLETQILHREDGAWLPYTYRWNVEQTDAELVHSVGASETLSIKDADAPGGVREQTYRFASRAECQLCHNAWVEARSTMLGVQTASPLAVTTPQLNRPVGHANGTENQLAVLTQSGWVSGAVPEDAPRFADPRDTHADLNERVRSYLHVNCSHCHQIHAGGTATINLTHDVPLADAKLIDVRPTQGTFGLSDARLVASRDPLASVLLYRIAKTGGGRMPRLGSEFVDDQAVAMISDWIAQLPLPANSPPHNRHKERTLAALAGVQTGTAEVRAAAVQTLIADTRGAFALARKLESGAITGDARADVLAATAQHPQAEIRDLFERFIPASQRVHRLGETVDVDKLLAMKGSAEQGRSLFFRDGAAACKNCHRLAGQGTELGPDLSQIGKKYPPRDLLSQILDPSKQMDPKYVPYILETTSGRVVSGLLVEKTEQAVRLRDTRNEEIRVPADEIELLVPQQKSLMPDLLLRDMTPQQVADLLAFLGGLK